MFLLYIFSFFLFLLLLKVMYSALKCRLLIYPGKLLQYIVTKQIYIIYTTQTNIKLITSKLTGKLFLHVTVYEWWLHLYFYLWHVYFWQTFFSVKFLYNGIKYIFYFYLTIRFYSFKLDSILYVSFYCVYFSLSPSIWLHYSILLLFYNAFNITVLYFIYFKIAHR